MRDANMAMDALRRIVRALRSAATAMSDTRVTAAQVFVLKAIAARPRQSLGEVCEQTLTSQSSVSEVVTRLMFAGLVTRDVDASDRRRTHFSLTELGQRVVATAAETPQERLIAGFASLPVEQQRSLANGLQAWIAASGMKNVPATMFLELT